MASDLIPDDVRQFILERIDSVATLEGLLLLRRDQDKCWTADALARELYTSPQQTQDVLSHLYSQGLLAVDDDDSHTFQYQPGSKTLEQTVDRLATTYSKYLVPVTNLIHSIPQARIQQFADAFKVRKTNKDK